MGEHARQLQPLETQATPLRWMLLECMAREYPEKMAGIGEIWAALSAYLVGHDMQDDEHLHAWAIRATGNQEDASAWEFVSPAVNAWARGLGFHGPERVTPEFSAWLAEAAVLCSAHPLATSEPARAVIETARNNDVWQEVFYEELPDMPQPTAPEYDPNFMTAPEYLAQVKLYMAEVTAWYSQHGAERVVKRDPEVMASHTDSD